MHMKKDSNCRGAFISPDITIGELLRRYPMVRMILQNHVATDMEAARDMRLVDFLEQFRQRPCGAITHDVMAAWINNTAGAYYGAAPVDGSTDWMHSSGPAPEGFYPETPRPVELTADRIGIVRRGGLGMPWYWACNGAFSVRYVQRTGAIDTLSCWNWKSGPRGLEKIFRDGFLSFGTDRAPHAFGDATLWPFGFDNRWGDKLEHRSRLVLEGHSILLNLKVNGSARVTLDWTARRLGENFLWRTVGWNPEVRALALYLASVNNPGSGNYRPLPHGISRQEFLDFRNMSPAHDYSRDYLAAGSLYLLIGVNGLEPSADGDGRLTWSRPSELTWLLSAGTTYHEALEEFHRVRGNPAAAQDRCANHYRRVSRRAARVRAPDHPNIETIGAVAPLLLDSLKLDGNRQLRHSAGWSYADTHTSLMSMDAMLYAGDYEHVDRFLAFVGDPVRRGPRGQIAISCHYDETIDSVSHPYVFHDLAWIAMIGRLQWHSRIPGAGKHYADGIEHAKRILAEADPDAMLFKTRGYWPDFPLMTVGRKGVKNWPAQEAGVWYEALRNLEALAFRQNDSREAARWGAAARKLRSRFLPLFYDPDIGFLCDHVDPATRKRHPFYSSFHIYFLNGMFGQELLDAATARHMADTAYRGLYDASWKFFRTSLEVGPYHSELEYTECHWFAVLAKLFRLARHREGLLALRESLEFHYGKFVNFIEAFNLQPSMTVEQHSHNGWFNNCMATRYQVILEGFFGVNLGTEHIGICPVGLSGGPLRLEGLPVGASRWNFDYRGDGVWPVEVRLDGKSHAHSWVFPGRLLKGGEHQVEVVFGGQPPPHPVLVEATGLELTGATLRNGALKITLRGPGRAYARFLAPSKPRVTREGKRLPVEWDEPSRQATVALASKDREPFAVLVQ